MKILDLDMDYFMNEVISGHLVNSSKRLDNSYSKLVWSKDQVIDFLENNLGLSKQNKLKGRIVTGHNEALYFWGELIEKNKLKTPFEVIHVDSHADLGIGYGSWKYILDELLNYEPAERPINNSCKIEIGDYLLFAIAYQWISKITYCANPNGSKNDYILYTFKNFHENQISDKPIENIIQFAFNPNMKRPENIEADSLKKLYFFNATYKDPEVSLITIPTIDDVKYDGDFDYVVLAQSPEYTPESADFIMDIFRQYIDEI